MWRNGLNRSNYVFFSASVSLIGLALGDLFPDRLGHEGFDHVRAD